MTNLAFAVFLCACGSGDDNDGNSCGGDELVVQTNAARAGAAEPYQPPNAPACPELDVPAGGAPESTGLIDTEYAALVAADRGNFYDDSELWLKALPRGEQHVNPTDLSGPDCKHYEFSQFSYDYQAATPPIASVPECGRYLVGFQAGWRKGQTWPQVLDWDSSSYVRMAPLVPSPVFGTFGRLVTENAGSLAETFPSVSRIDVKKRKGQVEVVATIHGVAFEGVVHARLEPATPSTLHVDVKLFPRMPDAGTVQLGIGSLASMYWKGPADTLDVPNDEAHDADTLIVNYGDGSSHSVALANPPYDSAEPWTRTAVPASGSPITSFSLRQNQRDPNVYAAVAALRYAERPTITISDITTALPIRLELLTSHASNANFGNVIANLVVDTSGSDFAAGTGELDFSYVMTASEE